MKILPLLLAFLLLLPACGGGGSGTDGTLEIYRVLKQEYRTDGELLRAESVAWDGSSDKLSAILEALAAEPDDPELDCSLPSGVSVSAYSTEGSELMLTLSEGYLELSGFEKTLTDYCLTLSLLTLDKLKTVSVYVDGELISSGLSSADVLLYDNEESPYEKQVRLYFPDSEGRYLNAEYHTLSVAEDAALERYVIDELLRGPNDETLASAIPEGTELISVSTTDGLCTVRFSGEFYANRPKTAAEERLVIYSIVNSLTSLADVEAVKLEIEGRASGRYLYIDLSGELERCDSVIGPYNGSRGEMDLDLYMALPGRDRLTPVPHIISRDEYLSTEECAILALSAAESSGGAISLLAGCGEPNLVSTRNGVCSVDLPSGYFDPCGENAQLAVEALVATLCGIDGVNYVRLTQNGVPLECGGRTYTGELTVNEEIILP